MPVVKLRLRAVREKAGLTQEQLANATGLRQATISNLETGKSERITLETVGRLARALVVKPGDLFEWARGARD